MNKVLTITLAITTLIGLIGAGTLTGADFDGDSRDDIAIFRPSTGMWAVRGVTRAYFGGSSDTPVAGDYNGDGIAEIGIFRGSSGMWAIQGVTRAYFGGSSDIAVSGGAGQLTYDYVVKAGDAADLVAALESTTYKSVFIPTGNYSVGETIRVTDVRQITGEGNFASINFTGNNYLSIENDHCIIEKIRVKNGGYNWYGAITINDADYVTLRDCRSIDSAAYGFSYRGIIPTTSNHATLINCVARNSSQSGFRGDPAVEDSHIIGCSAIGSVMAGFSECYNLTGCFVDGLNIVSGKGFSQCFNLSSCQAADCQTAGFYQCDRLSACRAVGDGSTSTYGFRSCDYVAASYASDCTTDWSNCAATAACND